MSEGFLRRLLGGGAVAPRELVAAPPTYFFPNQSPQTRALEEKLRKEVAQLPEESRLIIYEVFSNTLTSFEPTTFELADKVLIAHQKGSDWSFPRPLPLVKLSHILFGYEELLARKYCLPGFVEVEEGDTVLECGAYVGGFTVGASKIAREVHSFEPDELNFECLSRNCSSQPNVVLNLQGLYSESKTMILNLSASSVEHSLLLPDDGVVVGTREISVVTISDYCSGKGIEKIDFAKIEAEGVELEVFEGLGEMRPEKFAIDVSPERNGESPAEEFKERLRSLGYLVRQRDHVLFARK